MLDGWRQEDPSTTKKLPVEADVPEFMAELGRAKDTTELTKVVGDCGLMAYCYVHPLGVDPYLQDTKFQHRVRCITGVAARVRPGFSGRGRQVQAPTVSTAISAVGQTIVLATGKNPLKIEGSDNYLPRISQMLDEWR